MTKLIILFSCLMITLPANASGMLFIEDIDQMLVDRNLVNADYKYKDMQSVQVLFSDLETVFNTILNDNEKMADIHADSTNIKLTDLKISPSVLQIKFVMNRAINSEEVKTMESRIKNDFHIKNQCSKIYNARFQKANDYVVVWELYTLEGNLIATATFDKKLCS